MQYVQSEEFIIFMMKNNHINGRAALNDLEFSPFGDCFKPAVNP